MENKIKQYKKFILPSGAYFIVEVIEILETWEKDDLAYGTMHGIVIYSPQDIWPIGYESIKWGLSLFKDCSKYVVEVDKENEMWIVTDVSLEIDAENYFGGFYEPSERGAGYFIEWDCDEPMDREEIEEEILKLL